MLYYIFSFVGLCFSIFGFSLLYKYGVSPFVQEDGGVVYYEQKTLEDRQKTLNKIQQKKKLGFLLTMIGAIAQLIALVSSYFTFSKSLP